MDHKKEYKNKLELAKEWHNDPATTTKEKERLEAIFPELKESEDERIRKEMIEILKNEAHEFPSSVVANKSNSWIAWLEKQGEQKPSEDEDREYACQSSEHYTRRELMIYNLGIIDGKRMIEDAIKETEQNPAWSEEDWDYYTAIIAKLEVTQDDALLTDNQMEFLKSLKNRVQPQPKQEWSEEDEQYLLVCKNALAKYQVSDKWDSQIISHWLEDKLKSIRPQNTWKPSKEQMKALERCVDYLDESDNEDAGVIGSLCHDLKLL